MATQRENPGSKKLSEVTRRGVIDYLSAEEGGLWSGALTEDEFLARLYDLNALPSDDYRFNTAAGDIRQHRVEWNDWPDDWVFFDHRFNLMHASDLHFLRFLCETVHPVVRPDAEEARELANTYNQMLQADGWTLTEKGQMSGRPIFQPQRIGARLEVFSEPTGWTKVDRQVQEARLQLDSAQTEEQFQAIGLFCRETLISVAEAGFDQARHHTPDGVQPNNTDAARMLEAFFETELRGGSNEEARAHAKASLKLALALQHRRTADFKMAALCCEATTSVVNIVAVLSGRRRAEQHQGSDTIQEAVNSLQRTTVQGAIMADVFLKMAPLLGERLDQGQFATRVNESFGMVTQAGTQTGGGYEALGLLEQLGVVERKHPGDPRNQGHPYVRSVYITDFGRRVLMRLMR